MEPRPEQQPEQRQPRLVIPITTEYGSFPLNVFGDPNELLIIPTRYFEKSVLLSRSSTVENETPPTPAETEEPARSHAKRDRYADLAEENEQLRAELEALKNALNTQKPPQD